MAIMQIQTNCGIVTAISILIGNFRCYFNTEWQFEMLKEAKKKMNMIMIFVKSKLQNSFLSFQ